MINQILQIIRHIYNMILNKLYFGSHFDKKRTSKIQEETTIIQLYVLLIIENNSSIETCVKYILF